MSLHGTSPFPDYSKKKNATNGKATNVKENADKNKANGGKGAQVRVYSFSMFEFDSLIAA